MNYVDLHVHSTASDGTFPPDQVVRYASEKGLRAIALTDHDTLDGLEKAKKAAAETGLELIPGIEMSCLYGTTELHILGFFVDEASPALPEGLRRIRQIRQMRNETMLKRFQEDGFAITWEDLTAGNPDTVVTRAHFARVLTEKGYAPNRSKAFDRYLQYGGKYCMRKEPVTPEQVMELLRGAGAFISLAHPMLYHMGYKQLEDLLSYGRPAFLSEKPGPFRDRSMAFLPQPLSEPETEAACQNPGTSAHRRL